MSDTADTLEEIRERKRRELQQQTGGESSQAPAESASAPNEPIHVRDAGHFQEVVETYDVVLFDFYADWCGPCKMLEPIVEELARETDAAMAKVDVDRHQRLAQQYRVQGVPTMVLFADGDVAERIVGVREKHDLERLIRRHGSA
ncbi:MAG: thioredoxin [Halodesulfurarchaeum sp.]